MVELFRFGSDLMCGLLKALPCKNRRFRGENWFLSLVRTYSKSTMVSFVVPAQTLIGVKLLTRYFCIFWGKNSLQCYHHFIYIGLVWYKWKPPRSDTKKRTPSWGAVHRVQWHSNGESANTLTVASLQGANQGQSCRVLFNFVNWSRKKIISTLINFILVFYPRPTW